VQLASHGMHPQPPSSPFPFTPKLHLQNIQKLPELLAHKYRIAPPSSFKSQLAKPLGHIVPWCLHTNMQQDQMVVQGKGWKHSCGGAQ
jgi:hypothetical protein